MPGRAIGIDLGTTNCCVGVWHENRVEIISNDVGCRVTPSVVAFTDEERLIGETAKNQAHKNVKNTCVPILLRVSPSLQRARPVAMHVVTNAMDSDVD